MTDAVSRRVLFRWMGWYAMANAAVLAVIGFGYLGAESGGAGVIAWIYLVTIYISHHALLALLPMLLLVPLIMLFPRWRTLIVPGVLLMAAAIAIVLLDSLLWSQSRFHINTLTVKILGNKSWLFVATMLVIGIFFESMLASRIRAWVQSPGRRFGRPLGWLCVLSLVTAQCIYAWADASYYVPVTRLANQLPVYSGFTAKSFLSRHGLVDIAQSRERSLAARLASESGVAGAGGLDYPLTPMDCSGERPPNLLIILADALRADVLNETTTPRLTEFGQRRAANFDAHFSGGNSSRMGAFSFFYGLPPAYFASFEAIQRPPVLIEELQERGYAFGLFTSSTMYRPVTLDRTVFANVQDLRMSTKPDSDPSWKRDRTLTKEWFEWLDARDTSKPFFGFLFYDSPNARSFPPGHEPRFAEQNGRPMAREFAQYQTAVHYTDGLIGEVIDGLSHRGLDDDTVVLISSDHGEEFDESGSGFDEHGSGYSDFQLHVPMLLSWPGQEPVRYGHRTSHYDIAPTLMKRLLSCANPVSDYSSGSDLYDGEDWSWLIAGSYFNYAVLEPDQVTVTFPNGLYEVRDRNYRLLDRPAFRGEVLEAVMEENTRFLKQ